MILNDIVAFYNTKLQKSHLALKYVSEKLRQSK